jgi:hypothetical protein
MSRTRRESLSATVLGRDDGHISCPRVRHVGLNFGDQDPIEAVVHPTEPTRAILRCVLILGLCTPYLYDPSRPVLLTRASLTRCLELFEGEGYYA